VERTYTLERAAHARSVATAKGRRVGRPVLVDAHQLAYAAHLREAGHSIAEIVTRTGIARTSLYQHLPPRPAEQLTLNSAEADWPAELVAPPTRPDAVRGAGRGAAAVLASVIWPRGYRPACPACDQPTIGLREQWAQPRGVREPVVVARA